MATFDSFSLNPLVLNGLHRMGITAPTPIQEASLPASLDLRDVVGLAPTGTGKTLAYTIPLAQRLLENPPPKRKGRPVDPAKRLRTLVLCPVRELAQQVAEEARTLLKGSVLRSKAVYGKSALRPQRDAIESGVDLLVGTPGRLRELIDCGSLSLAHVRQVVVDEADRMLDMGFLPQVRFLLNRIPEERQMMFFSATMPAPIAELASQFLRVPFRAEISANTTVSHVGQSSIHVPDSVKVPVVLALTKGENRRGVIVFSRTRRRAGWVATALRRHDLSVGLVHGNRSQAQRQNAIERFSSGDLAILVATDVAARGLHIPAIKTVINYDLPVSTEEYVHRVGRAAHGGGVGDAFTLVSPREEDHWKRFRSVSGTRVPRVDPPDYEPWMRPVDLERMARARDGVKALRKLELRKSHTGKPAGKSRSPRQKSGSAAPALGNERAQAAKEALTGRKKKSSKKKKKDDPKFGARGNATRRLSKQRPIKRGQSPGSGVRPSK